MSNSAPSGNIGLFGLLGVVFVTLKLCKVIDWPWLWVTAPFWGPLAVLLVILVIFGIGVCCSLLIDLVTSK